MRGCPYQCHWWGNPRPQIFAVINTLKIHCKTILSWPFLTTIFKNINCDSTYKRSVSNFSWFTWFIDLYFWKIIKICTINYFLLFCPKGTCTISTVFDRYRVERGAQSANQKNLVSIRPSSGTNRYFSGKYLSSYRKQTKNLSKIK